MIASRRLLVLVGLALALLATLARPGGAAAHPLGNFTVNQYSRLELTADGLRLVYVLDLAELPTFQDRGLLDADGDGTIADGERAAYRDAKLAEIAAALHLTAGEREVPLRLVERDLALPPGEAGLATTRLEAVFAADLPAGTGTLGYRNDYATDRLGWREIVVSHGAGVRLDASDAPPTDISRELRAYPEDLLSSPLDRRTAAVAFTVGPPNPPILGGARDGSSAAVEFPSPELGGGVGGGGQPSPPGIGGLGGPAPALLALLVAMGWGAVHALSPGHGKTVVGAYLVGARGTPRHALVLGLTVTLTHTVGVVALGLVTIFASRYVLPERLYPWLSLASGLLVVALGLTILRQRLRGGPGFGHHHHHHDHDHSHSHDHDHAHDHEHGHHHDHPHVHSHGGRPHSHLPPGGDGSAVTWRSLLALGIAGGLLPCPSALIALLGAIALGQAGFGLLLVLAFSVGLAGTLTAVGVLFLSAGRFLERRARGGRWTGALLRYAPIGGALGVTVAGLAIVVRALGETWLL